MHGDAWADALLEQPELRHAIDEHDHLTVEGHLPALDRVRQVAQFRKRRGE
ncbi:MAG TPA: hypothetical protein VGL06_00125 [Pseudonocardiaceae bacterium]